MAHNFIPTLRDRIIDLMEMSVPERKYEVRALWEKYNPDVEIKADAKKITLHAHKNKIIIDAKTMELFWLIGFSGWKAVECYAPHVISAALLQSSISEMFNQDQQLYDYEQDYKTRRTVAQQLIDTDDPNSITWPHDIAHPVPRRSDLVGVQDQVTFDLTCIATAFVFFHEFRHVMFFVDNNRPDEIRDEELACDIWARSFMTDKLAKYANATNQHFQDPLCIRSMGLALAVLILFEITPSWDHGGNEYYYSLATRMQAIVENTNLSDESHFWIYFSALLIGICRQKHISIGSPPSEPILLAKYLAHLLE